MDGAANTLAQELKPSKLRVLRLESDVEHEVQKRRATEDECAKAIDDITRLRQELLASEEAVTTYQHEINKMQQEISRLKSEVRSQVQAVKVTEGALEDAKAAASKTIALLQQPSMWTIMLPIFD